MIPRNLGVGASRRYDAWVFSFTSVGTSSWCVGHDDLGVWAFPPLGLERWKERSGSVWVHEEGRLGPLLGNIAAIRGVGVWVQSYGVTDVFDKVTRRCLGVYNAGIWAFDNSALVEVRLLLGHSLSPEILCSGR